MVNISQAFKNNRLMLSLTGLSIKEFNNLLPAFTREWRQDQYDKYLEEINTRKRRPGGGSKGTLPAMAEKLFFILFYYKCYPTFDFLGFVFSCERGNAKKRKDKFERILEKALGKKLVLPKRKISSLDEFLEAFPEARDIIIDGTERPIRRPKNNQKQRKNYSGKKKRHTRKNLIITTGRNKKIGYLSETAEGKKHDFTMLKELKLPDHIPKHIRKHLDLAFLGFKKTFPGHKISMPKKKPRNKELSYYHKRKNKEKSSFRVLIEHAIGGVKRYKIVSDVFRNRIDDADDRVMLIACGLWNYHLGQTS
jgi:hypothetical protein